MERRLQKVSEENGGLCPEDGRSVDDANPVVQETGCDPVSGSGEHHADSEGVFENLDLESFSPRLRARFERQAEEDVRLTREMKDDLCALLPSERVFFDASSADRSAIMAGGQIEAFITVLNMDELKNLFAWCSERTVDYRFVCNMGKTLVRDAGLDGLAVKLSGDFDYVKMTDSNENEALLETGAATSVSKIVGFCAENGLSGIEKLLEISGSMAGCLFSNVETEGGKLSETIEEVTILNKEGKELTLRGKSLRFEEDRFKIPSTACITRVLLRLKKRDKSEILAEIEKINTKKSLDDLAGKGVIAKVFTNMEKTKAETLIEDAGLSGIRIGKARIYPKHTNSIINEGGERAKDIIVLMNLVKDQVKQQTGIVLAPAINIIGKR